MDVVLFLGTNEMNIPQDDEKLKQLILSSIDQPSSSNIRVSVIRPQNDKMAFREFQDLDDTIDLVTFTKTLDTKKPDEASIIIFREDGRPTARRIVMLFVNGTLLLSEELITQWNKTFVDNDVVVIPVVFGSPGDGDRLLPIARGSGVHTIEPDDDPVKKGEKIAQDVVKGKFRFIYGTFCQHD